MPDSSGKSHNNIRAGIFVLASVALGIAVFVILSGWDPFISRVPYKARFSVAQGIDGLASGSDVKIGGLLKGTVTGINPVYTETSTGSKALDSILVNFELDADVTLYSNAQVTRYMPLLGGSAWLNFDSVGGPSPKDPGATKLPSGGELTATAGGGMLATLLGPTNAARTSDALGNIDQFTSFLLEIPEAWHKKVIPMIDNAQSVIADIRNDYGPWSKKVTTFLDNIDSAAMKINRDLDDVPPLLASAQKDLDEIGDLVTTNSPKIDTAMDNLVSMSEDGKAILSKFRTETMSEIDKILEKGLQGITTLDDALDRIDTELALRMPDITALLANLRQASAQLKLTTLEVRRSPWKLLYTPSTEVLAHENLYSAARDFVLATTQLEAAASSFREVFELDPGLLERQPQVRKEVEQFVLDSLERFKKAQERLFSEIVDQ